MPGTKTTNDTLGCNSKNVASMEFLSSTPTRVLCVTVGFPVCKTHWYTGARPLTWLGLEPVVHEERLRQLEEDKVKGSINLMGKSQTLPRASGTE